MHNPGKFKHFVWLIDQYITIKLVIDGLILIEYDSILICLYKHR